MASQFPPIEPFESGMLDVGDGQKIYWECCGNPKGVPALFLHGGPASGCSVNQRRFFDPSVYRAVLFDQRGCGRSRPLANDPAVGLESQTTAHLIADIERLRAFLEVDKWVILGLSWGTTLGLAYAEQFPERVRAMVLGAVTTTSASEVRWLTEDAGRIFPRAWEAFASVPDEVRGIPLVEAYAQLLASSDATVRDRAAQAWCAWEDAHVSLTPGHKPSERFKDPAFRYLFARLVTHYWRHAAFFEGDQLVRDADRLTGIPGVLIHGVHDVSSPAVTAWELSKRWTTSRLHLLGDSGHGGGASFPTLILEALEEFGRPA